MSKIEKPAAIADLASIVEHSDGLMVARGDLGVEMPIERVPGLQKQIVGKSRAAGKPVVVATQMLESMISSPVPTRAEVSDVATAVFDGADAVMLSAESAVGKYPIEAIRMMDRIAVQVENDPSYPAILHAARTEPQPTAADAIAAAAHTVADTLQLACIICYTATGSTALRVARERPGLPVIGLSPVVATGRKLAWPGACTACSPPIRRTRPPWCARPAASPSTRASPRPARASSSSPACRSAPPAPPTWCASPTSTPRATRWRRGCESFRFFTVGEPAGYTSQISQTLRSLPIVTSYLTRHKKNGGLA